MPKLEMNGNSKLILTTLIGIIFSFMAWGGYNIVAQGNETAKLCERVDRNKSEVRDARERDITILRKLDKIVDNTSVLKIDIEVLKHDVKAIKDEQERIKEALHENDSGG
jgi:predicted  nucleic acid-binding Zn-ribbon protein